MERVLIIGCSGAGKSTLAVRLGDILKLPVVHLDRIYWTEGWKPCPREMFRDRLDVELARPKWIIDGNFGSTLALRAEYCDTVIYLDMPTVLCLLRVMKRVLSTFGRVRPDMADGCPEQIDLAFLLWVARFNKKNRANTYELLSGLEGKRIIVIKNSRELKSFVEGLDCETAKEADNGIC